MEIHLAPLSHMHISNGYSPMLYMIDFCDQKLWDVKCLVRMRRALTSGFREEAFNDL